MVIHCGTGDSVVVKNRQIWGGHGEVLAQAATKGQAWISGLVAAGSVSVSAVQVTPKGQTISVVWAVTETMWVSEGCATTGGHADLSGLCC